MRLKGSQPRYESSGVLAVEAGMLSAPKPLTRTKIEMTELANWIYYEDGSTYYCFLCVEKRLMEINTNREFSDEIDYDQGDECGYFQDYANEDYPAECCKCHKPLLTNHPKN